MTTFLLIALCVILISPLCSGDGDHRIDENRWDSD